ncbi:hypothetical protein AMTR_s00003p00044650 [Amborella trichopoda]|uniref:Uncharacterized protein n=1 Tax=Amborella trichopoda TaxID=13333 RepID=W1P5Z4_AMBTC|nr:hypothetical protein AMTR_s00003p00044650 [Amborella trichopoda]
MTLDPIVASSVQEVDLVMIEPIREVTPVSSSPRTSSNLASRREENSPSILAKASGATSGATDKDLLLFGRN